MTRSLLFHHADYRNNLMILPHIIQAIAHHPTHYRNLINAHRLN